MPCKYQELLTKFEFKYSVLDADQNLSAKESIMLDRSITMVNLLELFNQKLEEDRTQFSQNFEKNTRLPLIVGPYSIQTFFSSDNILKPDQIFDLLTQEKGQKYLDAVKDEREIVFVPSYLHKNASAESSCLIKLNILMNRHNYSPSYLINVPSNLTNGELAELILEFSADRRLYIQKKGANNTFRDHAKHSSFHIYLLSRKGGSRKMIKFDVLNHKDSDIHWFSLVDDSGEQKMCTINFEFILEADSSLKIKS